MHCYREPESENSSTLVGEPPLVDDSDLKENKKRIKTRFVVLNNLKN